MLTRLSNGDHFAMFTKAARDHLYMNECDCETIKLYLQNTGSGLEFTCMPDFWSKLMIHE